MQLEMIKQRNGMRAVGKLATLIMTSAVPELFCELAFLKLTEHKDAAADINFHLISKYCKYKCTIKLACKQNFV